MPERVYTRFDDSDDDKPATNNSNNKQLELKKQDHQTSSDKKQQDSANNKKSKSASNKKRKRDVQPEENAEEQQQQQQQQQRIIPEPVVPLRSSEKSTNNSTNDYNDKKKWVNSNTKNNKKPARPQSNNQPSFSSLREKANALYTTRKTLPIFAHADEIRQQLKGNNNVMLLVGETGSGKSTQVPQFLADEAFCQPKKVKIINQDDGTKKEITVGGCIAITQPRRVAAISLARRVAEEMGTPLGKSSPASRVGYSVRFDTSTSPSTKVKFLTDGMLLQEMLHDPWLTKYSVVVVDEVHERGVNVDLVLGFLRKILASKNEGRGGIPLKVIAMSATADMESLQDFFGHDRDQAKITNTETSNRNTQDSPISVCHIKGRQFPVETIYSPEPVHDFLDAALKTIFTIHVKEPMPGDILVFLTGQETVENLENLINEYSIGIDPSLPKVLVLPLFAALPQAAQQRVFAPAPPRTRKIILATNIAETSVTVSGVRFVVDCGKAKMKQFRSRLGLDSLLVKPISKSAAIQRKGRAGREAPGKCYRLYTETDYLKLDETNTPEILRCDLSQSLLTMKARGVDDIMNFPFLTRPPREALEQALLQLLNIQALDETGKVSETGLHIAKLPLTPPLGRVLLEAAGHSQGCLLDVIDVISCLSVENIFLNINSEEKKEQAEQARRDLYRREGDHLTMLATVQGYAAENRDRKAWAERHMVSHRAMQSVMVSIFLSVHDSHC
jgi:ATP-dependent RNA helicase DHR2